MGGGALGSLLFGVAFCFIRTIIAAVNFFVWCSRTKCNAQIVKFKDKVINHDEKGKCSGVTYMYALEYELDGKKIGVGYNETQSSDKPSKLTLGESLLIYVDKNNLKMKALRDLKKDLVLWSLCLCGSILIAAVGILIIGQIY